MNLGYVVSRFPKTTETFIAREALGVSRLGHEVTMLAINRERDEIVQTDAAGFVSDLVAMSDASPQALAAAQLRWLRRSPQRLLRMWTRTLIGNASSFTFLARGAVAALGAPWVADRVDRRAIDHLHAHWGTHSALLAYQLSILTGLPYTVTLHAHDLYVERTMLHEKLRAAARVVTISEHNQDMITRLYPDVGDRIDVVHCGVDVAAIDRRAAQPENTPPVAVVVAGLRDYKGHRFLINACKILQRRGVVLNLELVGDGPLRSELEAMVAGSPIEDRVVFHGARPVDDAIKLVNQADVFVMPSIELPNGRKDGIPVALMEAMASGVPVISTRVSGIPELVEHEVTGLLADEQDAEGLADALERLLGDADLRQRLVEQARRRVEEQFDLGQTVGAMDQVVRDAAADRSDKDRHAGADGSSDRSLTVAMLTHNYLPAVGGAERQLNSLNPLFVAGGITPIVFTRSRPGLPAAEVINQALVIRIRCVGPAPVKSVMFVLGALVQLLRTRPQVVHAYDTLTPSLVAGLYRMMTGTPYLTKLLRSGDLGDLNRLEAKPMGRARLGLLKRSVSRFVAISQDLETELADRGVDENRRVFIPNGVDTDRFQPPGTIDDDQVRWAQRADVFPDWPQAPVTVVVGRVSAEKRVVELARAWAADTRRPDAWLYVVGEGPLANELDGLERVRFLGRREDVADILRWADVYVSASSAEGLSNALLEAMAAGCPGVVTNVGGVADVVVDGTSGTIVAPESADRSADAVAQDMVDRVVQLLDDPALRAAQSSAARRTVIERYSLAATAAALIGQYRDLNRRGARH